MAQKRGEDGRRMIEGWLVRRAILSRPRHNARYRARATCARVGASMHERIRSEYSEKKSIEESGIQFQSRY